ncbi:hypothetical protein COOONC_09979 [Cooperia oncophora]
MFELAFIAPSVTETPKYLGKSLTVYYKHHIGAYSGVGTIFKEARGLLPAGATTFGIFYDNPRVRITMRFFMKDARQGLPNVDRNFTAPCPFD